MSLLPIIYTSLVLFFGVMLLVIIISYISFKAKAVKNPLIEEEQRKLNLLNSPQRIINPSFQSHDIKHQRANNSFLETKPIAASHKYFNADSHRDSQVTKAHNLSQVENGYKNYDSAKTKFTKHPRIQIMNEIPKYSRNNNSQVSKVKANEDISKFDLLSYYSDYKDPSLVALKAVPVVR